MENISNPTLYKQVYDAAIKKARNNEIPTRLLYQNDVLYRGISRTRPKTVDSDEKWLHIVDGFVTSASVQGHIVVRDQFDDWNRFTGASPDPNMEVMRGGCYFFQQEAAGIAEMRHYALKPPTRGQLALNLGPLKESIPHLMASKVVLKIRLTAPKLLADLSLFSSARDVSATLRSLGLPLQAVREDDYSVTRALGHAMQAISYFHGLIAQTARETGRSTETGDNICLFGKNQAPIEGLRIESAYFFFPPGLLNAQGKFESEYEIVKVEVKDVRPPTMQLELGI